MNVILLELKAINNLKSKTKKLINDDRSIYSAKQTGSIYLSVQKLVDCVTLQHRTCSKS